MVRVSRIPTVALAALLGALYLALNPPSADIAAHLYRADLVQRAVEECLHPLLPSGLAELVHRGALLDELNEPGWDVDDRKLFKVS